MNTLNLKYEGGGEFPKRLFLETYGCQMNVADSEVVASVMQMAGYGTTDDLDRADAIFINTCSVRDNAEQRIFARLNTLNALRRKRQRRLIIGIIGCMAERMKDELISNHGVDLVAGPDSYLELPSLIAAAENGEKAINVELSTTETYRDVIPTRISANRISGFISIMRGCNNFCTYCIVPYTRGRERSREPQSILNELRDLQAKGFKEVTLLGQNVNSYLFKRTRGQEDERTRGREDERTRGQEDKRQENEPRRWWRVVPLPALAHNVLVHNHYVKLHITLLARPLFLRQSRDARSARC